MNGKKTYESEQELLKGIIPSPKRHFAVYYAKENTPQTGFPCELVAVRRPAHFAYRIPGNEQLCYEFVMTDYDNKSLSCVHCTKIYRKQKKAGKFPTYPRSRMSDGFSLCDDPIHYHLEGCQPIFYSKLFESYPFKDDVIITNPKYKYSVERMLPNNSFVFLYRLPQNPGLCYRFESNDSDNHLICLNCLRSGNRRKGSKRDLSISMAGFDSDPQLNHKTECEPKAYEDVMKNYIRVENDKIEGIIAEQNMSKQDRRRAEIRKIFAGHGIGTQRTEQPTNHRTPTSLWEMDTKPTNDDQILPEEDVNSNEKSLKSWKSRKRHSVFSETYEVAFFTEKEIRISTDGNRVSIKCQRESLEVDDISGFLCYSVDLPPSIDISSVRAKWVDGQIILSASR